MTKPKIGSIIRYPYWTPESKWVVLRHGSITGEDDDTVYVDVVCIGNGFKTTLVAYIGKDKMDSLHPNSSAHWEYVT